MVPACGTRVVQTRPRTMSYPAQLCLSRMIPAAAIGGATVLRPFSDQAGVGQCCPCESAGEALRLIESMHYTSVVNVSKLVRDLEQALKQTEAA